MTSAVESRPRRRLRLVGVVAALIVIRGSELLAWFLMRRPVGEIKDFYPREGPAGSLVLPELSEPVDPERVGLRCDDLP